MGAAPSPYGAGVFVSAFPDMILVDLMIEVRYKIVLEIKHSGGWIVISKWMSGMTSADDVTLALRNSAGHSPANSKGCQRSDDDDGLSGSLWVLIYYHLRDQTTASVPGRPLSSPPPRS